MVILLNFIMIVIMGLVVMGFYTLLERKILGYSQLRKGPNKISLMGILQPMSDGIKLFMKSKLIPISSNFNLFIFSSIFVLFIALNLWIISPINNNYFLTFGILIFICLSSLNVFCVIFLSWSSNSKYSLLGAMRNISQMISYEISMFIIIILFLLELKNMNIFLMFKESFLMLIFYLPILFLMWFVSILAELGRAPLDFNEGESELVSGFNTEYGGALFAFIFMGEYMNIIILMMITKMFFFLSFSQFFFFFEKLLLLFEIVLLLTFVLLIRSSYPRFRYDLLMMMTWKLFLPLSIVLILFLLAKQIKFM